MEISTVAAIAEVVDVLDQRSLEGAYLRVTSAKRLAKSHHRDTPDNASNGTLGMIFARKAAVPVEDIVAHLEALNAATHSDHWPDRLALAGLCSVEYGVQIPGGAELSSWFPPAAGGHSCFPGFYIVLLKTIGADRVLTHTATWILQFLKIFRRITDIPPLPKPQVGERKAIVITGYQFNLGGELKPVPDEFFRDRMVPEVPIQILAPAKKEPLGVVRFVPWQDGGVIVLSGKVPLEGLLVFSGLNPKTWTVVRPKSDLQVSSILPMSRVQFVELLRVAGSRSNLRFHQPKEQFLVQKVADEGTASPYIARLMLGLLSLRDIAYDRDEAGRLAFDRLFEAMHQSLSTCRENVDDLMGLWRRHADGVASGELVERGGQTIRITEAIDRSLRREVADFLTSAVRISKDNLQNLACLLGADIGFLFQKQSGFEGGLARIANHDVLLGEYLAKTRKWSEELVLARNAIEHEGWVLPRVFYETAANTVQPVEPEIHGVPFTRFATFMLDRTCCLVEDVLAHLLQAKIGPDVTIAEVSPPQRTNASPVRFTITLAKGGLKPWALAYGETPFLDR